MGDDKEGFTGPDQRRFERHPPEPISYRISGILARLLTGGFNPEEANREILRVTREESGYDALTGVLPRGVFIDKLDAEIKESKDNPQRTMGVVFIDVDDFKNFNSSRGHAGGDAVLVSIADTLKEGAGNAGVVGRLGGDEFAVILCGVAWEKMQEMAREMGRKVLDGHLGATVSMGLAKYKDGEDRVEILTRADRELYRAKERGRNQLSVEGEPKFVKYK